MLVSPVQPSKAYSPILVTLLGITLFLQPLISELVSFIIKQLFSERYMTFPLSTVMFVSSAQLEKAYSPILVTLSGIVTLVRLVQP